MLGPRPQLIARLLKNLSSQDKRKFFQTLHQRPSPLKTDPSLRKRITTGGEYGPISNMDMIRLADQQAGDLDQYLRIEKLKDLIGGSAESSEDSILRLLELMLNPTKPQRIGTDRRSGLFNVAKRSRSFGEMPF